MVGFDSGLKRIVCSWLIFSGFYYSGISGGLELFLLLRRVFDPLSLALSRSTRLNAGHKGEGNVVFAGGPGPDVEWNCLLVYPFSPALSRG
jgi:hypothetical protein